MNFQLQYQDLKLSLVRRRARQDGTKMRWMRTMPEDSHCNERVSDVTDALGHMGHGGVHVEEGI